MAVRMTLVDDLDETEGATTRDFAIDGVSYEIDLNDKNAAKLRKALEPFIAAGRKVSFGAPKKRMTAPRRSAPSSLPGRGDQMNAIREWARANGKKVSDRGRIPRDVQDAFAKAHTPTKAPAAKRNGSTPALAAK